MAKKRTVFVYTVWTDRHKLIVIQLYRKIDTTDLAERLGKTVMAVRQKARVLGVAKTDACRKWTPEERAAALAFKGRYVRPLCLYLDRSPYSVKRGIRRYRIAAEKQQPVS